MSYTVDYRVEGFKLPVEVILNSIVRCTDGAIKDRINELKVISDEEMLHKEYQELKRLEGQLAEVIIRVQHTDVRIAINGVGNTRNVFGHPGGCIIVSQDFKSCYIPGHEGQDLEMILVDEFYVPKSGYFTDNYDGTIGPIQTLIERFEMNCSIHYLQDEAGSEIDPDEKVQIYVSGQMQ